LDPKPNEARRSKDGMQAKRPIRINDVWKYDDTDEKPVSLYVHRGRRVFKLNTAASTVWLLLDGKHEMEEIADAVCEQHGADDKQTVLSDIKHLLDILEMEKLISYDWSVFE